MQVVLNIKYKILKSKKTRKQNIKKLLYQKKKNKKIKTE